MGSLLDLTTDLKSLKFGSAPSSDRPGGGNSGQPFTTTPIPGTLGDAELARLADPSLYRERLETFRNREILPEAYVEQYGRDLRFHGLDPDTKIIKGTLGANREANGGPPHSAQDTRCTT